MKYNLKFFKVKEISALKINTFAYTLQLSLVDFTLTRQNIFKRKILDYYDVRFYYKAHFLCIINGYR